MTRDDASRKMRDDALDTIRASAERKMNDTRLDPLRRPGPRKLIALAVLAIAISTAWAFSSEGGWSLILLALVIAGWFLLQAINRGFMDFPDELVDERIRSLRNDTYRESYIWLGAVLSINALAALFLYAGGRTLDLGLTPYGHAMGLFWVMAVLPGVVFALKVREI